MRNKYLETRLNLDIAKKNIAEIKRLSALTGVAYCCIGALEQEQKDLENAFLNPMANPNKNLGVIPLIVGGAIAVSAAVASIIGIWKASEWHKQTTEVERLKQENIRYAIENGIDPATFCPPPAQSPTEKLINTVKGAIIIGGVVLLVMVLGKNKMLKGVFK